MSDQCENPTCSVCRPDVSDQPKPEGCVCDVFGPANCRPCSPPWPTPPREAALEQLPSPMHSFDGWFWAESFVAHVNQNPAIPLDVDTMASWFCSALMRGYDEGRGPQMPEPDPSRAAFNTPKPGFCDCGRPLATMCFGCIEEDRQASLLTPDRAAFVTQVREQLAKWSKQPVMGIVTVIVSGRASAYARLNGWPATLEAIAEALWMEEK